MHEKMENLPEWGPDYPEDLPIPFLPTGKRPPVELDLETAVEDTMLTFQAKFDDDLPTPGSFYCHAYLNGHQVGDPATLGTSHTLERYGRKASRLAAAVDLASDLSFHYDNFRLVNEEHGIEIVVKCKDETEAKTEDLPTDKIPVGW